MLFIIPHVYFIFLALSHVTEGARKPESILLSNVKTLTLRKDLKTSHNRVAAVPQLKCIGGNAKGLYEIDVLRCKNQGADYDEENVQWTCTASLPPEFKLGSTDVICEGFASSSDTHVLKGSCGVEYRLVLTAAGEERYGHKSSNRWGSDGDGIGQSNWPAIIFWALFISVLGWMIYSVYNNRQNRVGGGRGTNPWGGGGGDGGGPDEPPPPYDYHPPPSTKSFSSSSRARPAPAAHHQEGWRPGFWTGALGGGAVGYAAGNRAAAANNQPQTRNGNGEGSSAAAWGGGGSSYSSTRHESSGFGSTSRR